MGVRLNRPLTNLISGFNESFNKRNYAKLNMRTQPREKNTCHQSLQPGKSIHSAQLQSLDRKSNFSRSKFSLDHAKY